MKRLLIPLVVTFTAVTAALAFDPHATSAPIRYAIVRCPDGGAVPHVTAELTRTLRDELRRSGADVHIVPESVEEYRESESLAAADILVEVTIDDSDDHASGGIGHGVRVGRVVVGGEFGVVHTRGEATVRMYDAESLELVEEFVVAGGRTAPALTAISVGDPHGYFWFEIPLFRRSHQDQIVRLLARDAAEKIVNIGAE